MQSYNHSEYLWFVFFMLSHYCSSYPLFRKRTRFGKVGYSLEFTTRSLPCLTELFYLFYPRGTGIKIIPENIYELLTPIALAHVISGDGLVSRHGIVLCTDSYSVSDIVRLINVLIIKCRLNSTLQYHTPTQPRIYIKESSMPLLRHVVSPYMCYIMLYKIKL